MSWNILATEFIWYTQSNHNSTRQPETSEGSIAIKVCVTKLEDRSCNKKIAFTLQSLLTPLEQHRCMIVDGTRWPALGTRTKEMLLSRSIVLCRTQ
jgi:hypothetical protein